MFDSLTFKTFCFVEISTKYSLDFLVDMKRLILRWTRRRLSRKILFLILFFGSILILVYILTTATETVGNDQKTKLIFVISSDEDDGSFVLTEIFKRETDHFVYIEEPLRAVIAHLRETNTRFGIESPSNKVEIEQFLKEIITCRYTAKSDKYLKFLDIPQLKDVGLKMYCEPGADECSQVLSSDSMNLVCHANRNKHFVVTSSRSQFKNIRRLASIIDLKLPILTNQVIYYLDFVRDPRALVYAKIKKGGKNLTTYYYREFCNGLKQIPTRLQHRSLVVRYEGLSQRVRTLVNFLDLNDLEEHFDRQLRSINRPLRSKGPKNFQAIRKRNFDAKVRNWRKYLDFDVMSDVQRHCGEVLQAYGYDSIWTENELRDLSTVD